MSDRIMSFNDFTRGGQITMHAIRMFMQASRYVFMMTLGIGVFLFVSIAYMKTSPYDRYIFSEYLEVQLKILIHDEKAIHTIRTPQGQWVTLRANQFVKHPNTYKSLTRSLKAIYSSVVLTIFLTVGLFLIIIVFFKEKACYSEGPPPYEGVIE